MRRMHSRIHEIKEAAESAKDKKGTYGPDIDLSQYKKNATPHPYEEKLGSFGPEESDKLTAVGIDISQDQRSGTFLLKDQSVIHCRTKQDGLEVLSMKEALDRYQWLEEYWWKAVSVDADKYTAQAELSLNDGYFIRSYAFAKSLSPIQACLYMGVENLSQNVHNIIIAEEGSELHIITGCATAPYVLSGLHIGISEFYIKKGAKLTFTMIHNWGRDVMVRPRSAAIVEEEGIFLSNFACLHPVRSLQLYPVTRLVGQGAIARFHSILLATPGSDLDTGARVFLQAPQTRSEIITRAISTGGKIMARGHLIGEVPGIKAHLECMGLLLSEKGGIHAVPELEGKVGGVDMSHEAAVGKIAQEEVEYLMARGLTEEEATSTIVRGFLDVRIEGLPPSLQEELSRVIKQSEKALM